MAENEATFRINIDGNAAKASREIASEARLAAQAIGEYEAEIKALSADLRRLRGNSDEVKAAKEAIKKRIDEARASVSALTKELAKQGTTYTAAAAAARKYGAGVGRLPNLRRGLAKLLEPVQQKVSALLAPVGETVRKRLAPAGGAVDRFGKRAGSAIGGVGKAVKQDLASVLPSASTMLGVVATAGAATAAALVAVGGAAFGAAAAVAAFGIASAAAHQKMARQREALLGNAKDAEALGEQIAVLAGKVPQGTAELNELSRQLSKTRLSGKAIVDTMNAVAQATGAVDASAGAALQNLITRGQHTGRMFLGLRELQGTGLEFDDVAKAYAEGTKKSIEAARSELLHGEVTIDAGAAALRKAAEKKFGALNIQNAFSLENAPKKLKEALMQLTAGIDLSPITKGLQYAFGQLAPEAPLGSAIKTFMETFGGGLVDIAGKSIPVLVEGLKWLLVYALRLGTTYYETKKKIQDAFKAENWFGVGVEIVKGLAKGILSAQQVSGDAIKNLAIAVKKSFTGELKIESPSKVFEQYGRFTSEGYAHGVERGASRANAAVRGMVEPPALPVSSTTNATTNIEVHIHGAPTNDAQAMQSPEFLSALTSAIRDAVARRGLVPA